MIFFEILKEKNAPIYYFGWLNLVVAIGCLLLAQFTDTQVAGANAWYKPFKFALSTVIFSWSMGWYLQYIEDIQTVTLYSWVVMGLLTFENVYIGLQAARGQLSHFNISTPTTSMLFSLMGIAAVGISLCTAYIGVLFFTKSFPTLPPAYLWSIRWGIIIFVIFSMQGLAMGARLRHTVGAPDGTAGLPVVNWSKTHGDLRIAHFLGMHALQVLPLLGHFLLKSVLFISLAALVYAALTAFIFIQALQGKPLFR